MIAASLIGMYFRPPIVAYVTQYAGQHDIARTGTISGQPSTQVIQSPLQPVDLLERAAAPLQRERDRAETLASELATARREVEALTALSNKKDDEAAQIKRAAETATSELQQSMQQARERIQALENQLAMAHRNFEAHMTTSRQANHNAAQVEQAEAVTSEFVQPQESRFREKSNEAARLNRAADSATAGLSHSLHQQRDKVEGPAPGSKSMKEVAGASSGGQLVPAAGKGSLEAAGLLARAKVLLGQGNIGAARIALERAVQTGSAQAAFALAETYDPLVLSSWRAYGTRGDATKARELYARAYDGGIKAAKDRSNALHLRRQPAGWFGREEAAIDE
jgi:hypothetical protein